MRDIRGMHLSNGPQYHVEKMLEAAPSCVTLLHFQMKDDPTLPQWSDRENENWIVKLRDGWPPQGIPPAPDRLIHVRMYHPNWTELDPRRHAQHTVDHCSHVESGGKVYNLLEDPLVCISPANEQNLHYECGDPDQGNQWRYRTVEWYIRIAEWNRAWAEEMDRLVPERRALLCWPAFAYGHDPEALRVTVHPDGSWGTERVLDWVQHELPDGEYSIPEVRRAMERYEILAAHPYAHLDWSDGAKTAPGGSDAYFHMLRTLRPAGYDGSHDPGGLLAQVPDKPVLLTESGTFTHSDTSKTPATATAISEALKDWAQCGRILGVTWFIWHSDSHKGNQIWPNEALRARLASGAPWMSDVRVPVARPGGGHVEPEPDPTPIPDPDPPDPGQPPDDTWAPRMTPEHRVTMIPRTGEGWGSFAARARGYGGLEPGWGVRSAWAEEIRRHNGLGDDAMLARGRAYRIPWFEVRP